MIIILNKILKIISHLIVLRNCPLSDENCQVMNPEFHYKFYLARLFQVLRYLGSTQPLL